MAPIAAPADKRFRRAQVKPGKKRSSHWRTAWLGFRLAALVAVMTYGGWRATSLVLRAHALQVAKIVVRGNERLATGEVLALVSGLRGQNILTVNLDAWRSRLLSSPWVEDAKLWRLLPGTVEIEVRERHPIGIARVASGLYLVDPHGVVVDEFGPNYADLDLPMIDGLNAAPGQSASMLDEARASLAARLLAALAVRPDLSAKISQIDVSDAHDAVVILDGDTAMLRLGEQDFVERLQEYVDLSEALRQQVAEIDYVDLRFDERLYVRPVRRTAPTKR
jgi:cell division protein FtsQ